MSFTKDGSIREPEQFCKLGKGSDEKSVVQALKQAEFIPLSSLAKRLAEIDSYRLESIAKQVPEVSHTVYDLILLRENEICPKTEERYFPTVMDFSTPCTPHLKWHSNVLRFINLDMDTAKKLSAILKGKYQETKPKELFEVLRKLEHMCTGTSFSEQEKSLALALIKIGTQNSTVPPAYTLYLCALLKEQNYPFAGTSLIECFESHPCIDYLDPVIEMVKERRALSTWCLKYFISIYNSQVMQIFTGIKSTIQELLSEKNIPAAVEILMPLYIHSTDELEKEMFESFGEHSHTLLDKCKESIWK
ncbi:hypothetical protein NEOKW01_0531 [Nematocida sp. AWRm80]|nr:hypothetical protein NEOKW01_0531 [Nematocida sp. AWRm80]